MLKPFAAGKKEHWQGIRLKIFTLRGGSVIAETTSQLALMRRHPHELTPRDVRHVEDHSDPRHKQTGIHSEGGGSVFPAAKRWFSC